MKNKTRLKLGDKVIVLSGKHKKQIGILLKIFKKKNFVLVKGVNLIKKHIKPTKHQSKGKINIEEGPIHISNIAFFDVKNNHSTRLGVKFIDNKKVRYAIKSKILL